MNHQNNRQRSKALVTVTAVTYKNGLAEQLDRLSLLPPSVWAGGEVGDGVFVWRGHSNLAPYKNLYVLYAVNWEATAGTRIC